MQVQAAYAGDIHPRQQTEARKPGAGGESENTHKGAAVPQGAIFGTCLQFTEPKVRRSESREATGRYTR